MKFKKLIIGLSTVGLLASSAFAFSVTPIKVDLSKNVKAAQIYAKNDSDKPLKFDVQVYKWEQRLDGSYKKTPIKRGSLFISPRIATVKPNSKKGIKIAKPIVGNDSSQYRILITQLKEKKKKKLKGAGANVEIAFAFDVPLFINETEGNHVKVDKVTDHSIILENPEKKKYDKITRFVYKDNSGKTKVLTGLWYILPKTKVEFKFPKEISNPTEVELKFSTNDKQTLKLK